VIDDINTSNVTANSIIEIIPIIYLLIPIIYLLKFLFGDFGEKIEYSDEPKEILQQRYARGEINSLEYLERMVRL